MRWENLDAVVELFEAARAEDEGHIAVVRMDDEGEEQLSTHPIDEDDELVPWLERVATDAVGDGDGIKLRVRWSVDGRNRGSRVCRAWPDPSERLADQPTTAIVRHQVPIRDPVAECASCAAERTVRDNAEDRAARAEREIERLRAERTAEQTLRDARDRVRDEQHASALAHLRKKLEKARSRIAARDVQIAEYASTLTRTGRGLLTRTGH